MRQNILGSHAEWIGRLKSSRTKFLPVRCFTEMFAIPKSTAYTMLETGEIPGVRVGHFWRIPKDYIISILEDLNEGYEICDK